MKTRALGAVTAQGVQAGISFVLQVLVARWLGVEELGRFAILYGLIVVAIAVVTGFVGDSVVVLDRADARIRAALQGSALTIAVISASRRRRSSASPIGLVSARRGDRVRPRDGGVRRRGGGASLAHGVVRVLPGRDRRPLRVRGDPRDRPGRRVRRSEARRSPPSSSASRSDEVVAIAVAIVLLPRDDRRLVAVPARRLPRASPATEPGGDSSSCCAPRCSRSCASRWVPRPASPPSACSRRPASTSRRSMLVIAGLTSFLFVDYARDSALDMRARLRRADRAVGGLLAADRRSMAIVALVLLGWAGPLLFGVELDALSVIGWLAYAASVAAVTPYGSARRGRRAAVEGVRDPHRRHRAVGAPGGWRVVARGGAPDHAPAARGGLTPRRARDSRPSCSVHFSGSRTAPTPTAPGTGPDAPEAS